MSSRPIAYVMEQTLGSVTHYLNLRRAESLHDGPVNRWLPLEHGPVQPVPWTIRGSWQARRALAPILDEVDGIFIHTMTVAPGSIDLFRKKPVVISSDATPAAKKSMRAMYGNGAEARLVARMKRELHRRVLQQADAFVAWSTWAAESFVRDYGRRAADVAVIPPGIDLGLFGPGRRDHELPRILFVGGDFDRKGGRLLREVFRRCLRGRAELALVTREAVEAEPGVTVFRDITPNSAELLELFASSDIFAMPTRADCYPLVFMEALAAGLPVIGTRVGGIPDLVRHGVTGYLVDVDDGAALQHALERLVEAPALRREMSKAARADAERRFDLQRNANALFDFVRSRC